MEIAVNQLSVQTATARLSVLTPANPVSSQSTEPTNQDILASDPITNPPQLVPPVSKKGELIIFCSKKITIIKCK